MNSARVYKLGKPEEDDSIQRGIAIPPRRNGKPSKYRARMELLEVGDSFFVKQGRQCNALRIAKELAVEITTRSIGNGIRIWRTK